ncbi:MAG: hypothetical protein EpisKO_41510 [Epibacterium sp.]
MSNLAEHLAEQAAFTARYEALSAIGRLAHELGASLETSEDIDEALAYCEARQERMDARQLRTLDAARADANEDAAEGTSTALCKARRCDHPESQKREYSVALGISVRAYGHATVMAKTAEDAAEIVRASASQQTGPWDAAHEVDWSTANEPSILYVTDEETNEDEIGNIDLSPANEPCAVIDADTLASLIKGEESEKPRQIVDTENPAHMLDSVANLRVIWAALEALREDLLPEGDASYDAQWDEITSAMASITEDLGIEPQEV